MDASTEPAATPSDTDPVSSRTDATGQEMEIEKSLGDSVGDPTREPAASGSGVRSGSNSVAPGKKMLAS